MPVTLQWEFDEPQEVEAQDLILSTDGGATFNLKIAAHLPSNQHQLIWAAAPQNATGRARLDVALHLKNGSIVEVISDEFTILAEPRNRKAASAAAAKVLSGEGVNAITPAFANPGACVSSTLPILNYNMNHPTPCSSYRGEPSLAQDPTNPDHFFTATGFFNTTAGINSTVPWAYSGSSTTQSFVFSPYFSRGDMTTAIGVDGTVYVVSLAATGSEGPIDTIVVFRSKTSGSSFEAAVAIPGISGGFDKPVVAAHPTQKNVLVVTYLVPGVGAYAAICNKASTGSLTNASNWDASLLTRMSGGIPISAVPQTHPVIDPISTSSSSYWLFVVQTSQQVASPPPQAGYAIFQYQLANTDLTLGPAIHDEIQVASVKVSDNPPTFASAPTWTINPAHEALERALRVWDGIANINRAAIDYCDPNAHRMYIPTMVNTTNNPNFPDGGLTSDLFLTVWQYTGAESVQTKRILPAEAEKYAACAVTDGHGRVWVSAYAAAPFNNYGNDQRGQPAAIAIDRASGDAGAIAYMSIRLPANQTIPVVFLGDYVYTEATFHPSSGGSRMTLPTFTDTPLGGGCSLADFRIEVSGWL